MIGGLLWLRALIATLADLARDEAVDAKRIVNAYCRDLVNPLPTPTADTPAIVTCLCASALPGARVLKMHYRCQRWPLVGEIVIDGGLENEERVRFRFSHRDLLRERGLPEFILARPLIHAHEVGASVQEARDFDSTREVK